MSDAVTAPILATAPGKVILFGEHAINRGQPAIAASVGLHSRCRVQMGEEYQFQAGAHFQRVQREDILSLGERVDRCRNVKDFEAVRNLAKQDYFAPQKYILATAIGKLLPGGLHLEWQSEVPSCSGLGSGGSAFAAMVTAISTFFPEQPPDSVRAEWAHRGDIVAHGGIASGLDTQTSLLGGMIHYTGEGLAERIPCAPGLSLVIAHCGVAAATSEVNTRVRLWLAEAPEVRGKYFETIGALSRAAVPLLAKGDWGELGRLLTLNQLVLEKIGVSCPEIERLIAAALGAGAFGAKISGSGGGGIVIALVSQERRDAVVQAMAKADGKMLTPEIGVPGARLESATRH